MSPASTIVYDPYDYAIDADPHPIWKRMRDDAPLYHNDPRCPVGAAITLEDRRQGDCGRNPCAHCASLLVQSIEAKLPTPAGQ